MNIKVNVALVKNQRVKGSATVVFDDCFKVRDIVILAKNDTGELYISMPFKTLKNGNKISIAYPLNPEFRAELQQAILDEYVCLRQMMLASPMMTASPNDVWLRHILLQTSHHCERSEQHHYAKHNFIWLSQTSLNLYCLLV